MSVDNVAEFYLRHFIAILLSVAIVIACCFVYQRKKWITKFRYFITILTGIHTLSLGLALFSGLKGFAAMGVMALLIYSWPITLCFFVLLFTSRERPHKARKSSNEPSEFEKRILENCGRLPHKRIALVEGGELDFTGIDSGLFFVFATWSHPALISFRLVCEALAETPDSDIVLFVIDADRLDYASFKAKLGNVPKGQGEVFWIKDGQIMHRDNGFKPETKDLLIQRQRELES